jgi:fructokinase
MGAALLAIGETIMDVVVEAGVRTEHPGGSPLNIAYGLGRLGRDVTLLTEFGDDAYGGAIVEHLASAGVTVLRDGSTAATSTATATIDDTGSAGYVFDITWELPDGFPLPDADIVHVGSLGAFVEPGGARVAAIVERIGATTLVAFDPNIRPSIGGEREAALERFERIARAATLVKLSDEDAAWLWPDLDQSAVLELVLALGPALVVMTRGPHGALLASPTARVDVPGRRVDVADTIGAGDSFMTGLIHRVALLVETGTADGDIRSGEIFRTPVLQDIGEFAVRCASITVSRAGANPPTLAELAESMGTRP